MAKQNDKRDALIASAAGLFWHQGYAVTSLADISATSGIPLGNIYYYFKTKGELAQGVADIFVGETEAMLAEISEANQNPRIRLQLLVEKLASHWAFGIFAMNLPRRPPGRRRRSAFSSVSLAGNLGDLAFVHQRHWALHAMR